MKTCTICKEKLDLSEFNKKSSSKDGLQPACRECNKKASQAYYSRNREHHIAVIKGNKAKYLERVREELWNYFVNNPCTDCDEADPRVLEFDHLRDKEQNISDMMRRGYSWNGMMKEIVKCDVVCANCHRKRTYKREGSWRNTKHFGSMV